MEAEAEAEAEEAEDWLVKTGTQPPKRSHF
jgi:hypothetical protein